MAKSFLAALSIFLLVSAGKTQDTLPPWGLTPRTGPPPVSTPATGSPLTLTVPAETEAAVQLLSGIHTQVSHLNDPVKARLVQPVYVNGRVALPRESLLDGRITMIHRAGRLGHSAELAFRFDQITLPDGQAAPIAAVLAALDNPRPAKAHLDPEGYLKGGSAISWRGVAGGLVALGTLATATATLGGTAALGSLLPVSGTALVAFTIVWPQGNDVHLPPRTRLRIRLNYPLTVRVPW